MHSNHLNFYDYDLPQSAIAQYPATPRDTSKLLVCNTPQPFTHSQFKNLKTFLPKDAVLVLNDTRVLPARFFLNHPKGRFECLVLQALRDGNRITQLHCLILKRKKIRVGDVLSGSNLCFTYSGPHAKDTKLACLTPNTALHISDWHQWLNTHGELPIPPYLNRTYDADREPTTYQTVYAQPEGEAIAAPTAGLHFTPELLDSLRESGTPIVKLTLTVGYGTFEPIQSEDLSNHVMHAESYHICKETWTHIQNAKHVVAVGTTTLRALEAFSVLRQKTFDWHQTDLFIRPGYDFNCVTHLITNFHLPKSSLLCLVYAFGGIDAMKQAYQAAINSSYRFYSYGDAMFIPGVHR